MAWSLRAYFDARPRSCRVRTKNKCYLFPLLQVLVYHDLLGMMQHPHHAKVTPKFCKQYAAVGEVGTHTPPDVRSTSRSSAASDHFSIARDHPTQQLTREGWPLPSPLRRAHTRTAATATHVWQGASPALPTIPCQNVLCMPLLC